MFSLNSFFSRKMTKLFDLCWLNVLCLVTCIPIITIGPAFTALYTVLLAMSKDQEAPVTKMFFRAFKENFKKGLAVGLIYTAIMALLIFDIQIWQVSQTETKPLFVTATVILIVLLAMLGCWLFPLMAKFENSVKNMFKNALIFAFKYFPVSASMGIVIIGYTVLVLEYIFSVWFLFMIFGIVLLAYPWTFYVRIRFEKYLDDRGAAETIRENIHGNCTDIQEDKQS